MVFKGISISNRYGNASHGKISKGIGIKECELAFTGGYMQVRSQFLFIPVLALFLIGETAYGQNAVPTAPSGIKQPLCGSSESKHYKVSASGESTPRERKAEAITYARGACREALKSKASNLAGGNSCKNTCNLSVCRGCQLERSKAIEPETFKSGLPTVTEVVRSLSTNGNPIQDVAHIVGGIFGGIATTYYKATLECSAIVEVTDRCGECEWFPDNDEGLPRESNQDSQLNYILEDPQTAMMCAELASSELSQEFSLEGSESYNDVP